MKRLFLIFCVIFSSSCQTGGSRSFKNACPDGFLGAETYGIDFEYASAEINEETYKKIDLIAQKAARNENEVCLSGQISYKGAPQNAAKIAMIRAQIVADLFVSSGVRVEKIYVETIPEESSALLFSPIRASQERFRLVVMVGG